MTAVRRAPCIGCGGPKEPGRSRKLCDACLSVSSPMIPLRCRDGSVSAYAIVDDADIELVRPYRWHRERDGYAKTGGRNKSYQMMHRLILGLTLGDGLIGDHINGDRLDNRRANLRIVTPEQSAQNLAPVRRGASGLRGVAWNSQQEKWQVSVVANGKRHYLGLFDSKEDGAAVASAFRAEHLPFSYDAIAGVPR